MVPQLWPLIRDHTREQWDDGLILEKESHLVEIIFQEESAQIIGACNVSAPDAVKSADHDANRAREQKLRCRIGWLIRICRKGERGRVTLPFSSICRCIWAGHLNAENERAPNAEERRGMQRRSFMGICDGHNGCIGQSGWPRRLSKWHPGTHLQGSAKRCAPGCVNAAGKTRQKW